MVAAVISQEDVNQVCNELSATGKNVNISTVFDVLGKGGPNTIKKYIAVWRETQTDDESGKDLAAISQDLPEAYTNQVMILGKALFNAAEQEMQATVTRINAEKEEAIAKAEEELKEVADVAEQLNSKNVDLEDQLETINQENSTLSDSIHNLETELTEQKAICDTKLAEALATISNLHQDLKDKNTEVKSLEASANKLQYQMSTLKNEISNSEEKHEETIKELKTEHESSFGVIEKIFLSEKKGLKDDNNELKNELRHSNNELIKEGRISGDLKGQMIQLEKQLKVALEKLEVKKPVASKKKAVTKNKT